MTSTVSTSMFPLVNIDDDFLLRGYVRLTITSLDPENLTCVKESWVNGKWESLADSNPSTPFDLSLSRIEMGLSSSKIIAFNEKRTVDVVQVSIRLSPPPTVPPTPLPLSFARFHETHGITAGSEEGRPFMKQFRLRNDKRAASFLSLRSAHQKGPHPFNIGLMITDPKTGKEMLIVYDPKIENDGSITPPPLPPPPPPPPPEEWP